MGLLSKVANQTGANVRKYLMHATVVVAVLIAVFYQDFQKRHSSVSGVPTTGAEDASLVSLRTKNPGIFSAFVALGLVSPHALMIGSRLYFEHGFDFFMFADNESPWKSPFTWAKAIVAPGALTCQYASHFYDTDPTAVKAMCTITILDDIIFWAFIATALGVASFSFSQDALRTLKEHTGEIAKKESAAVVKVVLHQLLVAGEALAVAAFVYVISLTGYAPVIDSVFAYILIVTFVVNLQIVVEKLVEMGVLTNAFEDVLSHVFNVATWPVVLFLQTMESFEDKAIPKPDFNQFEPVTAPAAAPVVPAASPAPSSTSPSQQGAGSPTPNAGGAPETISTPGSIGGGAAPL